MMQDQQTYQRAVVAAIIGLLAQSCLSLVVLVASLWAGSHALTTTTWYLFGGLPIWIILLLIYYQHRLERIESLETEQLVRTDTTAAAIFDEHAEDLQISRRRLARLNKWGPNVVSLFVAGYLLIVGLLRMYDGDAILSLESFGEFFATPGADKGNRVLAEWVDSGPITILSVSLALVMFLVARYISGMTKAKQWQLLRGGAGYLMGNAVVTVMIGVASIVMLFGGGNKVGFQILTMVVPLFMTLIGAEIAVAFLLNLYRPRRSGEVPRPAFDSRLLGWLTSPESLGRIVSETLNYQFGFEISRSWFYQVLSRAITPMLILGVVALMLLSSLVVVQPHEQAIVIRMGRIVGQPLEPGMHFKLPWPFSTARAYPVGRIQQIAVGSIDHPPEPGTAILWTTSHTHDEEEKERFLITAATRLEGIKRTSGQDSVEESVPGTSLVAAEVFVQHKIDNLQRYVQAGEKESERMLRVLANRCVKEYFANHDIDTILGHGRVQAGQELQGMIQEAVDDPRLELGLKVVFVGVAGVHPPQEEDVAASFHRQIGALQVKQSSIRKAEREAVMTLAKVAGSRDLALRIDQAITHVDELKRQKADPAAVKEADDQVKQLLEKEAKGRAAELIQQARAYRSQRALGEQAAARRFEAQLTAYRQAPHYYRRRAHLDALLKHITNARVFSISGELGTPSVIEVDLSDTAIGYDTAMDAEP